MSGRIAELVTDALACVAAEHPRAYAELERALGPRRFDLAIDDEHFMIDLGTTGLRGSVLEVTTDVATLCGLVLGERDVVAAALAGDLDIVASADDLVAAAMAMSRFLQGAVRCVSMQPLVDRLVALRKERT